MTITAAEQSRAPAIDPAIHPAHMRRARIFGVQFGLTFVTSIAALAEIVFEAAITVYTPWKGFRPSPILDDARWARS